MLNGSDQSHYQATFDATAQLAGGFVFCFHKATEWTNYPDAYIALYHTREQQALAAGLLWGAYHYLDNDDGIKQADYFLSVVYPNGKFDGKKALMLDFEAGTVPQAEAFVQRIHDVTGVYPILYTRASYINELIGSNPTTLSQCPLIVATYEAAPVLPKQWPKWTIWQHSNGVQGVEPFVVPGTGKCDTDFFDGTLDELKAFWATITPAAVLPATIFYPVGAAYLQTDHEPKDALTVGDWYRVNWIDNKYNLLGKIPSVHEGDDLVRYQTTCYGQPVYSIADGIVLFADTVPNSTWAQMIIIDHVDANEAHFTSRYAHLSAMLVKAGDSVKAAQHIGSVGDANGQLAPHLHHAICITDRLKLNPLDWPSTGHDADAATAIINANYVDPLAFIQARAGISVVPGLFKTLTVQASDGLRVRALPSTAASIITKLPFNKQVKATEEVIQRSDGLWREIVVPLEGFMMQKSPAGDIWLTENPPLPATATMYATDTLNIRSQPIQTSARLGQKHVGDKFDVLEPLQNSYVQLAPPAVGWVLAAYLSTTPPVVVVVPPPQFVNSYGAQCLNGTYGTELEKYPAFKAIDNPGAVARYHAANPTGLCIHRHYYPNPYDIDAVRFINESGGPVPAALRWYNDCAAAISALPYCFFEGLNETGYDPLVIEFEYQRIALLSARGVQAKACVLNLSTGTYNDDNLWKRPDMLRLMTAVVQSGGIVGLHAYGEGILSSNTGDFYWQKDGSWSKPGVDPLPTTFDTTQCWLAMRIIRVREVLDGQGLHPQLVATELGIDDCTDSDSKNGVYKPFGIQTRGWNDAKEVVWGKAGWLAGTDANAFYKRQLVWFCNTAKVPGLIYAYGDTTKGFDGKVGTYDVRGLL